MNLSLSTSMSTSSIYIDSGAERRHVHQRYNWTKEEDLDLIKYYSIKQSWVKVKKDNFPNVTPESLKAHYFYLLRQKIIDTTICNQFKEFPPPANSLKKKSVIKPICKVKLNRENHIEIYEQDLELIKRVSIHGSWENLKQNIISETNFALVQERYAFLLKHKYSHNLLLKQLEIYPPPRSLKILLATESTKNFAKELFSNLQFAQQDRLMSHDLNPSLSMIPFDGISSDSSKKDHELVLSHLKDWFSYELEELNSDQQFTEEERREIAKMQIDLVNEFTN